MLQCPVLKTAINVWENEGGGLPPPTDADASLGIPLFPPRIRVGRALPKTGTFQKESGEL